MNDTCTILAEDFSDAAVWTLRDAPQARRFYEKTGFTLSGSQKMDRLSDWSTGENVERVAVELRKSLTVS